MTGAEHSIQRAVTILEKIYGEDSAATAYAVTLLSSIEKQMGNADAAGAATARVDAINRKQGGTPAEHIGRSVSVPRALSKHDPEYSEKALKDRIQGSVVLSLVVDESGSPKDPKILLPLGMGLDEKALNAVGGWRFQPAMKNGVAVAVQAMIEVNFRLL